MATIEEYKELLRDPETFKAALALPGMVEELLKDDVVLQLVFDAEFNRITKGMR